MSRIAKFIKYFIALLLLLNGVLNIIGDTTILTFDIAFILSLIGFIIVSLSSKK